MGRQHAWMVMSQHGNNETATSELHHQNSRLTSADNNEVYMAVTDSAAVMVSLSVHASLTMKHLLTTETIKLHGKFSER